MADDYRHIGTTSIAAHDARHHGQIERPAQRQGEFS
jgi:hypothetical protein